MKKGNRALKARLSNMALARDKKRPSSKPKLTFNISMEIGEGRDPSESLPPGFDVWSASYKELSALIDSGKHDMQGPIAAQWFAASAIKERRADIEASGPELMRAVAIVARHGLVMPAWMAECYLARFAKIEKLEVASFDEAFGPLPYKPGARFEQFKKRRREIPLLSRELVSAIKADPTRPIDNALFEEVGSKLGMGKTRAQELYWDGVREHGLQDLSDLKEALLYRPSA